MSKEGSENTIDLIRFWKSIKSDHLNYSLYSLSVQVLIDETIWKLEKLKKLEDKEIAVDGH